VRELGSNHRPPCRLPKLTQASPYHTLKALNIVAQGKGPRVIERSRRPGLSIRNLAVERVAWISEGPMPRPQ
jgi:hypothetical protein